MKRKLLLVLLMLSSNIALFSDVPEIILQTEGIVEFMTTDSIINIWGFEDRVYIESRKDIEVDIDNKIVRDIEPDKEWRSAYGYRSNNLIVSRYFPDSSYKTSIHYLYNPLTEEYTEIKGIDRGRMKYAACRYIFHYTDEKYLLSFDVDSSESPLRKTVLVDGITGETENFLDYGMMGISPDKMHGIFYDGLYIRVINLQTKKIVSEKRYYSSFVEFSFISNDIFYNAETYNLSVYNLNLDKKAIIGYARPD